MIKTGNYLIIKSQRFNMNRMIKLVAMLFILVNGNISVSIANSFYEQRHRGWLWFEDKEKTEQEMMEQNKTVTPEQAEQQLEDFKRELKEKEFIMHVTRTPESVREYRMKELEMWKMADELQVAWHQAHFRYPELSNGLNEPVNIIAVREKRAVESQKLKQDIFEFARRFELVALFESSCGYCNKFGPILEDFTKDYNFTTQVIMTDDPIQQQVVNVLSTKLGIDGERPILIAVSKDGKVAFELRRGIAVLSELEESVKQAWIYLEQDNIMKRAGI
jgi:conjugal transfer pilus assembly protein TraF